MKYIFAIMKCKFSSFLILIFLLPSGFMTASSNSQDRRPYDTFEFLERRGYSYLVGITGPERVASLCIRSHYQASSDSASPIYLQFKYVPQKESQEALAEGIQEKDDYEEHPKEFGLTLYVRGEGALLDVVVRGDTTKTPVQGSFNVIYASHECLVIAPLPRKPPKNEETRMLHVD
uniref:Putative lipocalin n=1 Tax=Rhipicephalus microplus TaxID=6941 RepID=A0A6G5A334_RHIMP